MKRTQITLEAGFNLIECMLAIFAGRPKIKATDFGIVDLDGNFLVYVNHQSLYVQINGVKVAVGILTDQITREDLYYLYDPSEIRPLIADYIQYALRKKQRVDIHV